MKSFYYILLIVLFALLVKDCATPRGPTGGEPDKIGPKIVETDPPNGTTNFDGDKVQFRFDQFIDRNSFRQNVSVEPDLGIDYKMDFGRKKASVKFLSPLPDNTTIIVKVGTDVTDTDRNKMDSPFDLALSTGDELDDAVITAHVLSAKTGKGTSGNRVFLYAEPFDLTQRSKYIAETDTAGLIHFGYLGEGTYKAFWADDVNRNRIWEQERETAQPFYSETFELSKGDSLDIGTVYISSPDTVSPEVDGVGLLSNRRLRLRLSEEVTWDQNSFFSVTDSLKNEFTRAIPLYTSEQDPAVLFAQSLKALPDSLFFLMQAEGIEDKAGNPLQIDISPLQGSSQADTTALRTISHNSGSGLFPDEALEVTYSKFIDDDTVLDSLIVVEGDQVKTGWQPVDIDYQILRISPQESWQPGIQYQFRVWNPWSQEREQIVPEIWQKNQLGSIELTLENGDSTKISHLSLTDAAESIRVDTTFTQAIVLDNLPPVEYKVTIFEDVNEDGKWNPGTVDPYTAPEPYSVRTNVPIRDGFTAQLSMTYKSKSDTTGTEQLPEEFNENSNQQ